ncbi:MAG: hypothetical protein ETSY1_09115 [Candidatus Entotheonella factor]|uniref:Uncharacterized protein n=1 Tax=Entotheonella factor TaxID=1429438 RepID=W4LSH4_ENTF1|nr:MAG: hypothetical protein ETSY1_09115 [Candidatus Entotheonella factor]
MGVRLTPVGGHRFAGNLLIRKAKTFAELGHTGIALRDWAISEFRNLGIVKALFGQAMSIGPLGLRLIAVERCPVKVKAALP